ncbi:MAG TPA: DUF421 domain-containing protein [Syntrophomonas sp.]|nr:DUF421 domain-containing protein [Syntrophomonas sp.]
MNEGLVVVVRSIIGFFTLLIFARVLGRQQISQLTFFDYVLGITIGSIAASLSVDLSSRAWPHWVGLLTWTAAVFLLQLVSIKWRQAFNYLVSEPTVVIMNGQIMEDALSSIRYTTSDLLGQLRDKGIFDLNQIGFAVVETNGKVSVLLKPEFLPVTPRDMNIDPQANSLSTELIYDGVIIESNLEKAKVDRLWLDSELNRLNLRPSEVFLATVDGDKKLYVDSYRDRIV